MAQLKFSFCVRFQMFFCIPCFHLYGASFSSVSSLLSSPLLLLLLLYFPPYFLWIVHWSSKSKLSPAFKVGYGLSKIAKTARASLFNLSPHPFFFVTCFFGVFWQSTLLCMLCSMHLVLYKHLTEIFNIIVK